MKIKNAFEEFYKQYRENKSMNARRTMLYAINRFAQWCNDNGIEDTTDITRNLIDLYAMKQETKSIEFDIKRLKTALRAMYKLQLIENQVYNDNIGRPKIKMYLSVEL